MKINIKLVNTLDERQSCIDIRKQVFVIGQGVPIAEEIDGKDNDSEHYIITVDGTPAATTRVRYINNCAKIERVCVLSSYQGLGLGKKIMSFVLESVKNNFNINLVKLGAQVQVIDFYTKFGFEICSDEYMDAGIAHRDMQLHW